jgi:hypothetical protein
MAVQVDPIKPTSKAPGIKLFKLKCDKPLSKLAFKVNLRRYTMGNHAGAAVTCLENSPALDTVAVGLGRAEQLYATKPRVESTCVCST